MLIDVAGHAAQLPALQRVAGGIGVNQAAARHVYNNGAGLHLCDAVQRQVSAQDVWIRSVTRTWLHMAARSVAWQLWKSYSCSFSI